MSYILKKDALMKKFLISCLLLLLVGSSQANEVSSPSVIDLSQLLQMEQLLGKITDQRVIFVSETHDRYEHHLNQLEVIKYQHERYPNLAIGLEFFQQPFQSVLDDYIAGNIDEATLIRKTEYFDRWRFDYRLYRPIFSYAREHGIPLLALNIEREITDQVKNGGIESLNDQQRARIPADINRDDIAYRSRLEQVFKQHPHAEDKNFEHFYQVQLLWDEGMAAKAADWLSQNPQGRMVILAGSGHVMYGSGIPNRLKRRLPIKTTSVINADPAMGINPDIGDFVIMTPSISLPPSGKMGVLLDVSVSPPKVKGFSQQSGAQQAGIEENDQITQINNMPIEDYTDIRIALMDTAVGEKITVEVSREELLFGSNKHRFEVKLQ